MTKILAFSGRKNSGKSTCTNYIFGKMLASIELPGGDALVSYFKISKKGKLIIPTDKEPHAIYDEATDQWYETEDGRSEGIFDPLSQDPLVKEVLFHNIWPHVKIYHFADALKETVCIGLLGLDRNLVYGSQEDKETPTHILWENFPMPRHLVGQAKGDFLKKRGLMTVREVLQMVGTDIFRAIYAPTWINACLKTINNESSGLALIADIRFPDEADAVHAAGGKIIRLTRSGLSSDTHKSEMALDDYEGFDAVLDNAECTQHETFEKLTKILGDIGIAA